MRIHGEPDDRIRPEPTARRRPLITVLAIVGVLGIGGGAWALQGDGDEGSPRSSAADPSAPAQIEPAAPGGAASGAPPAAPSDAARARPGAPGGDSGSGPDTSTSSPVLPGAAPHTYHPAQPNTRFSRYTVAPDGRALTAWLWGGQCESDRLVVASDTADAVAVRVEVTRTGDVCTDMAVENKADVMLPTPLGARRLVDAETGATITPGGNPFTAG
ncbi:hypothetical protein ACFRCG_18485 [Embleya sp. NPDC056575]|uniref:hypothetical protein n=1 Tax=unclassified Embleya TaxID=2699296 RepID=UPI0036BF20D8